MTLEDHAGDVARKARLMNEIALDRLLESAAVARAPWELFESSGVPPVGLEWDAAAAVLGLHAARWRALAEGWQAQPIAIEVWRELRVIQTSGRGMSVNAFVVWDPESREAAFFDTGFDADPLLDLVSRHSLQPLHLFITHTHHDHVAAMEPLRSRFPEIRLHTDYSGAPAVQRNRAGDVVSLGRLRISYRPTPGHADDGATYVIDAFGPGLGAVAVVGDALFAGSMGGAPGRGAEARRHIRESILSLPVETLICPGHGPLTTVGEAIATNPFFP